MAQTIIIKNGTGTPVDADVVKGELALNTDSGSLYYGDTAGAVSNDFTFGNVTASQFVGGGAGITGITAEWDGTHTGTANFTGAITASGDISSSGDVYAESIILPFGQAINWGGHDGNHISVDSGTGNIIFDTLPVQMGNGLNVGASITASGNISSSGAIYGAEVRTNNISGGSAGTITFNQTAYTGHLTITSGNNLRALGNVYLGNAISDTIEIDGHVTASGNISASGTISGSKGYFGSITLDSRLNANQIGSNGNVGNTEYGYLNGVTSAIQTQFDAKAPIASPSFTGNITASGNISSSGYIYADHYYSNGGGIAHDNGTTTFYGNTKLTEIDGTNIKLDAPVTASGEVSASGNIQANYVIAKIPMIQLSTSDNSTDMYQPYSGVGGGTLIEWDLEVIKDSDWFTHDTATNPDRITVVEAGRYEISYITAYNGNNNNDQRAMPTVKIFVNGAWETNKYLNNVGYLRRAAGINNVVNTGQYVIEVTAGDYIGLASGYQANYGANTGEAVELNRYNSSYGYSKLTIKKIG